MQLSVQNKIGICGDYALLDLTSQPVKTQFELLNSLSNLPLLDFCPKPYFSKEKDTKKDLGLSATVLNQF